MSTVALSRFLDPLAVEIKGEVERFRDWIPDADEKSFP